MRFITILAVLILALGGTGCARTIRLTPGRDAYYMVTTQTTPAQAQGSPGVTATLSSSAPGSSSQTLGTTSVPSMER